MKKVWILLVAMAMILGACGGNQPTTSQAEISNQGSGSVITSSAQNSETSGTSSTTTTSGEAAVTGSETVGADSVAENYVPYKAYGNNRYYYIYLDRDKLLQAIEKGEITERPELNRNISDLMVLPYYYEYATEFDERGVAIVLLSIDEDRNYALLIDHEGLPIAGENQRYSSIYRVGDKYLATHLEPESFIPKSFEVLDASGTVLKVFEDYPTYQNGILYFNGGEMFDLETMEYRTSPPTEQGKFSKAFDLGNGYFAVADFSETQLEIDPLVFRDGMGHYKMALYKDGNLLTDFSYFDVVPVGDDLFYLHDGTEYFFYNAKTGKRAYEHTVGTVMGDYEFSKHGSLILASRMYGTMYITEDKVLEHAYPFNLEGLMFAYVRKNIRGTIAVIPKIVSPDAKQEEWIRMLNERIEMDITDVVPPASPDDIVDMFRLSQQTSEATMLVDEHVIRVQNLVMAYDNVKGEAIDSFHFFHYDAKTGEPMWYQDWFYDSEAIDALLLERAEQIYLAEGASSGPVEDAATFFGSNTFARRISFDASGMILYLWSGLPPVSVTKDELLERMKPEYYEKLYLPMTESSGRLHK